MDTFRMIATVLSMVLGLGVTRLLLGLIAVFRARHRSPVYWVPIAWSACLFLTQLEFWWAINQLPTLRPTFSFVDFVSLVMLTLALFAASALLLPSNADDEKGGLKTYFDGDGRYGLLALGGFTALGFVANIVFFQASPLSSWGALDVPMIVLPLAAFFSTSSRAQALIVFAYAPILLVDTWFSLAA